MPFLSTEGVTKNFLKIGSFYQQVGDGGWTEYYGGQGAYSVFRKSSGILQVAQDNNVKTYMLVLVLWLVALLIIVYLDSLNLRASH